jgi:regulator of nucleoside diphosphate kinase
MRDRIYVTQTDFELLRQVAQRPRTGHAPELEYLEPLQEELDRAEVVEPEALPRDVITMNSEVNLRDLDSGEEKVYKLIFPTQPRGENTVSILAPIGTAMLGYRVGDVIEWSVPKGIRRLQVMEILYQPEAAAVSAG